MTDHNLNGPASSEITEAQLNAMTDDLEAAHRDGALPAMQRAVAEWSESLREGREGRTPNRRTFLLGGATLGVGGAVLAACGSSSKKSSTTTAKPPATSASTSPPTTASSGGSKLTGDLAVAGLAAGLENLAVFAYSSALSAAKAGKLGKVPPAVATFAETAEAQHKDHAQAWNAAITAAGHAAVTAPYAKLTPVVEADFAKVKNLTELAQLALLLENIAAQTYQDAISKLSAAKSIAVAATIQPVEMQHAAILYYVLGQYPGIQGSVSNKYAKGSPLAFNPTALSAA